MAMQFKLIILCMLLMPQAHATGLNQSSAGPEANKKAPVEALDLIEFLGELEDDDTASLDAAMAAIETQKNAAKNMHKPSTQEIKK